MKKWIINTLFILIMIQAISLVFVYAEETTSEKSYWIQSGAFGGKENAAILTKKLENEGYNVAWVSEKLTVVYTGPYRDYAEAKLYLSYMKDSGYEGFIIQKTIVNPIYETSPNNPADLDNALEETKIDENVRAGEDNSEIEDTETTEAQEAAFFSQDSEDEKLSEFIVTDETTGQTYISKNYYVGSDIRIEGVTGSYSMLFTMDEHWDVRDNAYIEIYYTPTPVSDFDNSTMTVYLNNVPIYSFWMREKDGQQRRVQVKLPIDLLEEEFNTIAFATYHKLTDARCEDETNQANWVVLGEDTHVHIEYMEESDEDSLVDFPYPFIKVHRDLPLDFIMTLPENPEDKDLRAAFMLAAYSGQINRFTNTNFVVESYEKLSKDHHNIIYIGSPDTLPDAFKAFFTESEMERLENEAVIKKVISPFDDAYRVLLIVSKKEEPMLKGIQKITEVELRNQMIEPVQWFSDDIEYTEDFSGEKLYISMEEMGYGNIFFQGSKYGAGSVFYELPKSWKVTEDAQIMVKFSYSDILDFDKSSISVYINNIPVGSKRFVEMTAADDILILPLPEEVLDDSSYTIQFDMSLIPKDYDCDSATFDKNLWGFISSETTLYLPHESQEKYSFGRYPAPFVMDGSMKDTIVVVPDQIDEAIIQNVSDVLTYIGRDVRYIEPIHFIRASEFDKNDYDKNIIAIGAYGNNKFISDMNDNLNVPIDENTGYYEQHKKIELLESFGQHMGSIQLFESPYKEGRFVLAVTGSTVQSVDFSVKYLSDLALMQRLIGDTAFINGAGAYRSEFIALKADELTEDEATEFELGQDADLQRKLTTEEIQRFVIVVVFIFVIIILSVIIVARSHSRSKHPMKK